VQEPKKIASASSPNAAINLDEIFRGRSSKGGFGKSTAGKRRLKQLSDSLRMTPIAKKGETDPQAMERVSSLRPPQRPEELIAELRRSTRRDSADVTAGKDAVANRSPGAESESLQKSSIHSPSRAKSPPAPNKHKKHRRSKAVSMSEAERQECTSSP
jgi:hypothetical protein